MSDAENPPTENGTGHSPTPEIQTPRGFVPVRPPKLQTIESLEDDVEVESILQHHVFQIAQEGDVKGLEHLLKNGINPNSKDEFRRTPLHYAVSIGCRCVNCLSNAEACTKLLLETQLIDINAQDDKGNTALHLAIENQLSKCAELLISAGADVCVKSNAGKDPVYLMLKKLPDTMLHLLDECLFVDQYDPKDQKCVLKVDFSPLVGNPKFKTINGKPASSISSSSCDFQSNLRVSWQPEMKLLKLVTENPGTRAWRKNILTHPVVQIFIEQEWSRVRKFFLSAVLLYMFYVVLYTYYILNVYLFKCPSNHFFVNRSHVNPDELKRNHLRREWFSSSNFKNDSVDDDDVPGMIDARLFHPDAISCQKATGVGFEVILILVLTSVLVLMELCKLVITPKLYIRSFLNVVVWIFIALIYYTTIPNLAKQESIGGVQYQASVLAVFLAWALILEQLSRFPSLGKYIEMFGVVLQSFGFFLLTFLALFIAFAIAFAMLFPTRTAFFKFLPAVVKTLVMMTGEMDYNTLFYATTEMVPGMSLGHIFFVAFVVVVAIVLMNVVIGLTVQDVQKLQAEGELRRVSRLILEMHRIECFVFSRRLPTPLGNKLKATISVLQPNKQGRREGLIFEFQPNYRKDRSVSKSVKEQALELASISYEKFKANECSKSKEHSNGQLSPHPVILRRLNRQHYKLIAAKSSIYRGRNKNV